MKTFFVILVIVLTFLVGFLIGTNTSSYEDKNSQVENTLKANEDYEVEYASTTNQKFYQKMVDMERNSILIFNGFPTCLTDMLILRKQPGEEIFSTEADTLYLLDRDLNLCDINRYVYYLFKDNHGNLWSLFRHNETFQLTREDEIRFKKLLEKKSQKD